MNQTVHNGFKTPQVNSLNGTTVPAVIKNRLCFHVSSVFFVLCYFWVSCCI